MRLGSIFLLSVAVAHAPARAQVVLPQEGAVAHACDETGQECSPIYGYRQLEADRITVLASGMWDVLDETGQAVSVLDQGDLEAVQGPDIARALQRLPGVTLTRNGGLGSFTGLSVRGAASEHVLVLVDGVRLNDVAGPAGGFDFGTVMGGSLERAELLRGSNSLVWGSDGLGGVVHLSTRTADGLETSAEYGGDEQFSGSLSLGDRGTSHAVGAHVGYVTRKGFSTAVGGDEKDGFEQIALSARGHVEIGHGLNLFANARHADGETEIDGFPPPDYLFADTLERQDTRQLSGRAGMEYVRDGVDVVASLAHAETDRDLIDEAIGGEPTYSAHGASTRAELRGRVALDDSLAFHAGGDWDRSRFSDGFSIAESDIGSAHAMLSYSGEGANLAAGLRYDHHDAFGGAWNFSANGRLQLSHGFHLRASYGEGFKAPSLFQLHSDFGNSILDPERSRSMDLGLDYVAQSGGHTASVTLFRRDSSDLIDFVSCFGVSDGICEDRPFGTYDNFGRARSQGIEVEGRFRPARVLEAGLAYSFIDSDNRDTGSALARRPHHALTLTSDWEVHQDGLSLGIDLRVVSRSFDDVANRVRLGGYALADIRAEFPLQGKLTLYGRVENLWGETYQTAAGYASQGRAAFLGVRASL